MWRFGPPPPPVRLRPSDGGRPRATRQSVCLTPIRLRTALPLWRLNGRTQCGDIPCRLFPFPTDCWQPIPSVRRGVRGRRSAVRFAYFSDERLPSGKPTREGFYSGDCVTYSYGRQFGYDTRNHCHRESATEYLQTTGFSSPSIVMGSGELDFSHGCVPSTSSTNCDGSAGYRVTSPATVGKRSCRRRVVRGN